MFLNKLMIEREGYYSGHGRPKADAPLVAVIEIQGPLGKTQINLPPEASQRIIAMVANELAESTKAVADAMTAEFINGAPLLAAE